MAETRREFRPWEFYEGVTFYDGVTAFGGDLRRHTAKTEIFNIDNGLGVIIDTVIMRLAVPVVIVGARIVYVHENSASGATGGAIAVGSTLGGVDIVGITNYSEASLGSHTELTILDGTLAANTTVFARHSGVAATVAGEAYIQIEYVLGTEA